jgi:hypothetical protein
MKDDISLRHKTKMLKIRVHAPLFEDFLSSFISLLKKRQFMIQNHKFQDEY